MTSAHTYWIPTNRPVKPCLVSYIKELDYWRRLTGEVVPAFVLDSGEPAIERLNAEAISEVGARYPELSIQHWKLSDQRAVVAKILRHADMPDGYLEYFAPTATNYGAVMNKIALFGAANGADFVHRRDSDTLLQDNCPFPIEAEMLALRGCGGLAKKPTPAAVGSGYVGEWNMDLKPFIEASPHLFSVFWQCLGVDSSLHDKIYTTLDQGSRDYYRQDDVKYTDKHGFNLPDAGNVALSSIYQLFPSLPSNAMSSDYMPFRFARGCGLPILYHQRRVVHEYHAERGDNVNGYLRSLLKYSDLRPVYSAFENALQESTIATDFAAITERQTWFADLLERNVQQDIDGRLKKLERFMREFISARYPRWVASQALTAEDVLHECIADYRKHIELIRVWSTIMASAKTVGMVSSGAQTADSGACSGLATSYSQSTESI